jgi:D-alanyl-D-alanine carboxypeptidase (penicillin-binding protein 5/6)
VLALPRKTGLAAVAVAMAASLLAAGLTACTGPAAAPRPAGRQSAAPGQPAATPAVTPAAPAAAVDGPPPQRIKGKGAELADAQAGALQVLWSRQPDTERPIGSITKVMTALVVIQAGGLNRKIRVPKSVLNYVAKYQAESAGLHPGDVLTTRQLLEAMLLQSACDAAYVLATAYGPGMPAFLTKMNAEAARLGMAHTHFTSPDGLPYPTEYSTYSTPADLLTLGSAAMKLTVFRAIVRQRFFQVHRKKGQRHSYWWNNTNDLIGSYQGADGIKDGYTDKALHCLLFEAERRGRTLIGVVLGSPATGPDSAALAATRMLNWGFRLKLTTG